LNVVYDLLEERGLLGDGLFVEEYTGIHSWVEDLTRYTVVHSREVAVLFVELALEAVGRVVGEESELAELWDDADEPKWRGSLEDLSERLRAALRQGRSAGAPGYV
jgi:Domain of unknown function (DUF4259)